jgi:hypothetical protein
MIHDKFDIGAFVDDFDKLYEKLEVKIRGYERYAKIMLNAKLPSDFIN